MKRPWNTRTRPREPRFLPRPRDPGRRGSPARRPRSVIETGGLLREDDPLLLEAPRTCRALLTRREHREPASGLQPAAAGLPLAAPLTSRESPGVKRSAMTRSDRSVDGRVVFL